MSDIKLCKGGQDGIDMTIEKEGSKYYLYCDICGEEAEELFFGFYEAVQYKKQNGYWRGGHVMKYKILRRDVQPFLTIGELVQDKHPELWQALQHHLPRDVTNSVLAPAELRGKEIYYAELMQERPGRSTDE